ncbi:RNA ligase [Halobacteria archaeon AArc-m2/3/4]|uniref:RNA ligase n=1 Tax=Natronoglomus mannanivorans TaxID=2979990 RepID=A0ABT2Q8K7_9EURY|nr:RNA ligase [Halobacteria archaeon AArc-m2/3/4]
MSSSPSPPPSKPYHEILGVSEESFDRLEEHLDRRVHDGLAYRHLSNHRSGVERGTVLVAGTVVRGFPKIPRTLTVSTGVPEHFDGPVAVEEKLNGYNVRLARIDGDVLAFTRSGLFCPFTTRIVRRELGAELEALFDEYPQTMVCGEMIGPENPYTAHEYPGVDSIAFCAFGWRDCVSGRPLSVPERRDRYESFGIPQTRHFGTDEPAIVADGLREIVEALDEEEREGVVMQSRDGSRQLKYTTSAANRGDLAYAFSMPFEYGQEFVFRRLVREAFQSVEWGESNSTASERAHRLGEAILCSMIESIEAVAAGETVGNRQTVRAEPETVDALLEHLRDQGLTLVIDEDRTTNGERVVTFCKRSQSTNDRIQNYLDGQIVDV